MVARCDITGNPIGTDTRPLGAPPCPCKSCTADRRKTIMCTGFRVYSNEESDHICRAMLHMVKETEPLQRERVARR